MLLRSSVLKKGFVCVLGGLEEFTKYENQDEDGFGGEVAGAVDADVDVEAAVEVDEVELEVDVDEVSSGASSMESWRARRSGSRSSSLEKSFGTKNGSGNGSGNGSENGDEKSSSPSSSSSSPGPAKVMTSKSSKQIWHVSI